MTSAFEIFGRCDVLVIFVLLATRIGVRRPFLGWGVQACVVQFFLWAVESTNLRVYA